MQLVAQLVGFSYETHRVTQAGVEPCLAESLEVLLTKAWVPSKAASYDLVYSIESLVCLTPRSRASLFLHAAFQPNLQVMTSWARVLVMVGAWA